MLPEKGYKRVLVISFYIALGVALCYFFFNYLLKWLWPIFVAAIMGVILQPIIRFLKKKLKMPNNISAIILVLIVYLGVGSIIFMIIYRVIGEVVSFSNYVLQNPDLNFASIESTVKSILSKAAIFDSNDAMNMAWNKITEALSSAASTVAGAIISSVAPIAQIIPSVLIAIVIMIVSSVYFASDYDKIVKFFSSQFAEDTKKKFITVKEHFQKTVIKYLRAYLLLMLITGVELYLGFTIIGQRYALLLAVIISIIDVLPVLGTGTVLIPWGAILLAVGNTKSGIFILLLYLVITVVRQILEPRIIGNYIGLYPLVTLVAMYTGLRSLGIMGMFLFPITVIILKELNDSGSISLWKTTSPVNEGKRENITTKVSHIIHDKNKKKDDDSKCQK